jgi:hypothetical protein
MRLLQIYPLSKFQVYSSMLTTATVLYIKVPKLNRLRTANLYHWTDISPFLSPAIPGNYPYALNLTFLDSISKLFIHSAGLKVTYHVSLVIVSSWCWDATQGLVQLRKSLSLSHTPALTINVLVHGAQQWHSSPGKGVGRPEC